MSAQTAASTVLDVRVRFAETDQMGVVHHSVYPVWFEACRVEWMRERSLSYRELEDSGISLAVARLEVVYRAAARFDDVVRVQATLATARSRLVVFDYRLSDAASGEPVATGRSEHVPTDRRGRAVRLPASWLEPLLR